MMKMEINKKSCLGYLVYFEATLTFRNHIIRQTVSERKREKQQTQKPLDLLV